MPRYDACLVDVYETVLSLDGAAHQALLADLAGVPPADFSAVARPWGPRVSDGRATLAEAFGAVLRECGKDPDDETVADLVAADARLMADLVVVHPDTAPFLESLRTAGVRTAFVSNCAENTRPLLDHLGLSPLVDELVLSCEVGAEKPDPTIYQVALERLGVAAERAVLVDDQRSYCDGAVALGLGAVRIDRAGRPADDAVASLAEVSAYL